jgi:hypothetical protein
MYNYIYLVGIELAFFASCTTARNTLCEAVDAFGRGVYRIALDKGAGARVGEGRIGYAVR